MLLNFLGGNAAANVFARSVGAGLRVVDAGVAGDAGRPPRPSRPTHRPGHPQRARRAGDDARPSATGRSPSAARSAPTATGTRSLRRDGHRQHLGRRAGRAQGRPACRSTRWSGAAPASTTPASRASAQVLARAAARTAAAARRRRRRCAEYGGFEMAMMAGAMLGAAAARRVVIVDGFIAGAAALVADGDRARRPRGALVFAHRSAEARPRRAARRTSAPRRCSTSGCGSARAPGALLAWPLVRAAAAMLTRDGELRERRGQRPGMSRRASPTKPRPSLLALRFLTRLPLAGGGSRPARMAAATGYLPAVGRR